MHTENDAAMMSAMQEQYYRDIELAERDRAVNGDYTAAGVEYLKRAATAQGILAQATAGETRKAHIRQSVQLVQEVAAISKRLGLEPVPTAAPRAKEAAQPVEAPADEPVRPGTSAGGGNAAPPKKDEEMGNFDPKKLILRATGVTFDDVIGKEEEISQLKQAIDPEELYRKFPSFKRQDQQAPQMHFLFYGPPGTGKSFLCEAIAGFVQQVYGDRGAFFNATSEDLGSKYVGVAEKRIGALFDAAKEYDFAVICLDDFEKMTLSRDSDDKNGGNYTDSFLREIDGVGSKTRAMVIGSTNYPWRVDDAMLSRLTNLVFLDYPCAEEIRNYLRSWHRKDIWHTLGEDEAVAEAMIEHMTDEAVRRHFSYRTLRLGLCPQLLRRAMDKTLQKYPHGDPNLTSYVPLDEADVDRALQGVSAPYDAAVHQRYRNYAREATGEALAADGGDKA